MSYRSKKRREAMVESAKNSFKGVLTWNDKLILPSDEDVEDVESIQSDDSIDITPPPPQNPIVTQVTYLLYFLLWATLYIIAVQFEFGAVYFILSLLVLIWINTRTGPKRKGEPSAYSVFNKNCEAIDGTLNAEQFEREIRYGASSMH
ncbi:SAYSvFN domain-containing protein 1 isoform X2 [Cephus cinctus]|uniref:SAYSvFN domain-containing protein 1 isoform X2 n=1 Tax=Cephus cinctus TaxID=211228 RepID=A0AAJ7VZG6_CEPCN|nr:SAYSvFN domain-containing protein 1 isoform X2 [Cephus cinctus]